MKTLIVCFYFLLIPAIVQAKVHLNDHDIERVKAVKAMISEVEKKSLEQMVESIEKTQYPQLNLMIQEAMARTYVDLVSEQNVQGKGKKEWLYSMVALNMAYFQFGGDKDSAGGTKNLNKLIRYKLKTYLPAGIYHQPGFHCAID